MLILIQPWTKVLQESISSPFPAQSYYTEAKWYGMEKAATIAPGSIPNRAGQKIFPVLLEDKNHTYYR